MRPLGLLLLILLTSFATCVISVDWISSWVRISSAFQVGRLLHVHPHPSLFGVRWLKAVDVSLSPRVSSNDAIESVRLAARKNCGAVVDSFTLYPGDGLSDDELSSGIAVVADNDIWSPFHTLSIKMPTREAQERAAALDLRVNPDRAPDAAVHAMLRPGKPKSDYWYMKLYEVISEGAVTGLVLLQCNLQWRACAVDAFSFGGTATESSLLHTLHGELTPSAGK